jgi:hypothetical protein
MKAAIREELEVTGREVKRRNFKERELVGQKMLELVQSGYSVAAAGRTLGLTQGQTNTISKLVGAGQVSKHGRWFNPLNLGDGTPSNVSKQGAVPPAQSTEKDA